jgi:protein TonB
MRLPGDTTAYPAAARSAQIQGVVVLAAAIGADGAVQSVEPVSGPALLEVAALNAVRAWRYRPWLVEGNAVPFTTQVIIHFEIDAPPQ